VVPGGRLAEFIRLGKQRIAERWPDAVYLSHPPHATLLVGMFADNPESRASVAAAVAGIRSFPITVTGPAVFPNDLRAGGGQTLVAEVAGMDARFHDLQLAVAEAMVPFRITHSQDDTPTTDALVRSERRYGFPFVGAHWKPHFSIASVPVPDSDEVVIRWLEERFRFEESVTEVSLWKVSGDTHTKLEAFPLLGS
jgi:2'-5' RNA ligase